MQNHLSTKLLILFFAVMVSLPVLSKDYNHSIEGHIVDNFNNNGVDSVLVTLMTNDSTVLGTCMTEGEEDNGYYKFEITKIGKYIIKAERIGYEDAYTNCELKSHREFALLPKPIRMTKIRQLKEVTVIATKIKMVMRGDTIVYNADAFNLAEGSMLDALIAKLPGSKMTKDGQIFVNGKRIQSLLVDGNEFFSGNPQLALENLPAYTVKKIKVFSKSGAASNIMGRDMNDKTYVMDVRLKKEYSQSYMGNMEGGIGANGRYSLKAMGTKFSDREKFDIIVDINNINLNQRAALEGDNSPQSIPNGRIAKKEFGLQWYRNFMGSPTNYFSTSNTYRHIGSDVESISNTRTFLPTGDSYKHSESFATSSSDHIISNNQFMIQDNALDGRLYTLNFLDFSYDRDKGFGSCESTTSDSASVLNDVLSSNSVESKDYTLSFKSEGGLKVVADMIRVNFGVSYDHNTQKTFSLDDVQYFSGTSARDYRNYYRDQMQQHFTINGGASYDYCLRFASVKLGYDYKYTFNKSDNLLYRLDKLSGYDSTRFDVLPSVVDELAQVMDDDNSYNFHEYRNVHTINLNGTNIHVNALGADIKFNLPVRFINANLYYERIGRHDVSRNKIFFEPSLSINHENNHWSWNYSANINSDFPDLTNMVDYRDDSDPLNIRLGNSTLRDIHRYHADGFLQYKGSQQRMFNISAGYNQTDNGVAFGLTFDKSTGISTIKPQSVNGNWGANIGFGYTQTIDKARLWTIDNQISANYNHSVDLATVDGYTESQRSIVHNYLLGDNLKLNFRPNDNYEFYFHAGGNYYIIRSDRDGFENIKASDYNIGMNAQVALPWKFSLTTDMTMYARRGYQSTEMNTTDWVWNAQLTRSFLKGKLVSKICGFDLLHQLSNTQYAVNAQGRTETWQNSLPRYVMLSLAWRFNVNPKQSN
ncbi:TonB-dependent receptor family protein [Prevotella cerevisiae]|uniref:TonB-dependent receptor family protein n=1 Tax=Segatella cerevisiae TaxID=2053716 RepID=A0ABT1BYD8_9BACT|nr:TonB-dependent receptor [Segatella cerevisiae]MCO6026101.1 TonB-dependent receptor family protein [Segatella cerevisiae]